MHAMLCGRRRHRESCDLLNQDCVLGITNAHESDSSIGMPIDALPDDLDALRALVSSLSSERDAAIEECRRVREQNDRLHHLLRQLQRAQFGRRSERLDPSQMQLALEDIETSIAEQDAQEDKKDTTETPAGCAFLIALAAFSAAALSSKDDFVCRSTWRR